jgi:fido (protein-threonine AMPylation protein)
MATPSEKLAQSLEILREIQGRGTIAIQAKELSRTHRERLMKNGFLQEVIKGWYIPARPNEQKGESTAWYTSFWGFCATYLSTRFGQHWCLSPEQSLSLHAGNWTVPQQLLIRTPEGNNRVAVLPHNTSLLITQHSMPEAKEIVVLKNLHVFSLNAALVACSPRFFSQHSTDLQAILATIRDASDILSLLLEGGHSFIAGRLAGAFRHIGRDAIADNIIKTMQAVGYDVREKDPFDALPTLTFTSREQSPYVNRMLIMWHKMREPIIEHFPKSSGLPINIEMYLANVEEAYVTDAYHSLSIEGYHVSPELIQRVRSGQWNSDNEKIDQDHRSALAARGYWQAFQAVKESVRKVLEGINPGKVIEDDHRNWYRELFGPSVTAGILRPADLAGYRNAPVYIRRSMHVPPNIEAVRDLMPAFCDLLRQETDASVRIVLGHFFFVYIHPYMDGNGRIGRFLMNVMLAAGSYPWVVVPVGLRTNYMAALEEASVRQNIGPFNHFLAHLVNDRLKGKALPKLLPDAN